MDIDFSSINLQYLIQARDVARQNPELASTILGLSAELVGVLAQVTTESLANSVKIQAPLLMVRGDSWWWERLFTALKERRPGEVDAVLAHASLAVAVSGCDRR